MRRLAQLASWTLAAWLKNPPTASRLMGESESLADFGTIEAVREAFGVRKKRSR